MLANRSVTVQMARHFYHSFPRRRAGETDERHQQKGIQILSAIKDMGLAMAPELVTWKIPQESGNVRLVTSLQVRACFTELDRTELVEHAKVFGDFALEFDIDTLRQMGAVPTIYLPQALPVPHEVLFSNVGPNIALNIDKGAYVLKQLAELERNSDKVWVSENIFNGELPISAPHWNNFTLQLRITEGDKWFSKQIDAKIIRDILTYIGWGVGSFDNLRGILNLTQALFYPTDDDRHDQPLRYYRQREWRLLANVICGDVALTRFLTDDEMRRLLEIDGHFWGHSIQFEGSPHRRIVFCQVIERHNNIPLADLISAVIVPPSAVELARRLFGDKVIVLQ